MPPMRPYENQGPTILASTLTVTIVAVLTTIARFYVRVKMIRNVGWDVSALLAKHQTITDITRTM
jgi:hypothetical protein